MATLFVLIIGICAPLFAEGTKSDPSTKAQGPILSNAEGSEEARGVDMVFDTATVIIRKTNAFFQGNLEFTMPADTDKYNNRESYTENAIGQKVPKSTR